MNPLSWLRNLARNAILAGIEDALAEVEGVEAAPQREAAKLLACRLESLPAPDNGHEPRARRRT